MDFIAKGIKGTERGGLSKLQLLPSQLRTVHPPPFIVLLRYPKIWELSRHDSTRVRAWHKRVLAEICHAFVITQEILIEDRLSAHVLCRRLYDCQDGI